MNSTQLPPLDGLIADATGETLRGLASTVSPANVIVELGSFKGKSACYIATGFRGQVYCIDPWDTKGNIKGKHDFTNPEVYATFLRQIAEVNVADRVHPIKNFSYEVAKTWPADRKIGMIFIDGGHTYDEVKRDFFAFEPFLVPDALVVFDDYTGPNRGVRQCVDELGKSGVLYNLNTAEVPLAIGRLRPLEESRLSATIMAHPKRERFIPYLQGKLNNAKVVWDQENNRWETGRRNMLAFDQNATHHVVVQDDALVCEDFIESVRRAAAYCPDNPISFYTGRVRPSEPLVRNRIAAALRARVSWFRMSGPWWGVAVCVPTKMIPDMVRYADRLTSVGNYDMRMTKFFDHERIKCAYSVPSLVSHRTGPDNPSLVPGRGNSNGRVAFEFIGEDVSALKVRWTRGYV